MANSKPTTSPKPPHAAYSQLLTAAAEQVAALRDERLRAEQSVWALKSEVETLSTRRDDAARRDRQRERDEGALSARREAIAAAAAREQERLGTATAAKETLEAEVAELDARAERLRAEVARATLDGAALREDASGAARRASEARSELASAEKAVARMACEAEILRSTKAALESELGGLKHELDALRGQASVGGGGGSSGSGHGGGSCAGRGAEPPARNDGGLMEEAGSVTAGPAVGAGAGGRSGSEWCVPSSARSGPVATPRNVQCPGDELEGGGGNGDDGGGGRGVGVLMHRQEAGVGAWKAPSRLRHRCGAEVDGLDVGGVGDSCRSGSLVDIVAEFQGRLRRQVQAALADGGVSSCDGRVGHPAARASTATPTAAAHRSPSVSRVMSLDLKGGPVRVRQAGESHGGADIHGRRQKIGESSGRGGSYHDVLAELEERIGNV